MRMTRAALRAQEYSATPSSERSCHSKNLLDHFDGEPLIHEDTDEQESSLQSSDAKITDDENCGRLALRDITTENYPTSSVDEITIEKSTEKQTKKGRGGRAKKKNIVEEVQEEQSVAQEYPLAQPAAEEENNFQHGGADAMEFLQSIDSKHKTNQVTDFTDITLVKTQEQFTSQEVFQNLEQHGQSIEAKRGNDQELSEDEIVTFAVSKDLTMKGLLDNMSETPDKRIEQPMSKTPRFNPELHSSPEIVAGQNKDMSEDSFIESIKTRSPSKLGNSQLTEMKHDPFVEDTITRTPSKGITSPRVEDSVEALDDLEDALEKFSDNLPAIQDLIVDSPVRQRKTPGKTITPASQVKKNVTPQSKSKKSPLSFAQKLTLSTTPKSIREKPLPRSIVRERVKEFESRPTLPTHRRTTSVSLARKTASTAPTMPTKPKHTATKYVPSVSSATGMSFSNSPAKVDPNPIKKRVPSGPLSTSKPAFVPAKSGKPTTRSTFVLPGEAVAAKLKAQREERAKREEEATEKKNQVKVKPAPSKVSRPSVMPRENKASLARMSMMVKGNTEDKENVAPSRPAVRPAGTSLTVTKRRPESTQVNTGARRTTTIAPLPSLASKRTTMSAVPVQRIISTSSNGPAVTVRGKEVFERQRNGREAELKEKKEKEEAAKRARAEAAERGRQASREWAEKQRKRLVEKSAAEPKSLSA